MTAEQRLQDLILRALEELGGRAKPSQLARKTLETVDGVEEASLQTIKAEIWHLVDQRDLVWTPERDIVASDRIAAPV